MIVLYYPTAFGAAGIFGGGERYALELARALARRRPTRLVGLGEAPSRRREGNLEIVVHPALRELHGNPVNPLSASFLTELRDASVVHCLIWNTLAADFATLYGSFTGKPVFVTDVGGGSSLTLATRLGLGARVKGFLLIAAQGGAQFTAYRDRWRIIYAGIDLERFRPPAEDADRRGVLFVGRLLPHKGIDVLLRAVDPETPLRIAGRPYDARYFALLQELAAGKNVTFVTDASDADLVRFYQTAQVSVLCSVYRTVYGDYAPLPELLGFTALEAMACGTPTIVTDVGGMSEVPVPGESGLLVPPSDVEALRGALRSLLDDADYRRRMGLAARARIEQKFTWSAVADRCLEAYDA